LEDGNASFNDLFTYSYNHWSCSYSGDIVVGVEKMIKGLREAINEFDKENTIIQIIIIGVNGAIRNIELEELE